MRYKFVIVRNTTYSNAIHTTYHNKL